MKSRGAWIVALLVVAIGVVARLVYKPFPPDTTPEGAYLRLARSVTEGHVEAAFPYLETEAQWASYTIRDSRKAALEIAGGAYPPEERDKLVRSYGALAAAPDGSDVFALIATARGYRDRLRKDMSGVDHVDLAGERATIVTARGTRYPFRRRENGIWGLTIFTGELVQEAERASRDLDIVRRAAEDYARAKPAH